MAKQKDRSILFRSCPCILRHIEFVAVLLRVPVFLKYAPAEEESVFPMPALKGVDPDAAGIFGVRMKHFAVPDVDSVVRDPLAAFVDPAII